MAPFPHQQRCRKLLQYVDSHARVLLHTQCCLSARHNGPHKPPPGSYRIARANERAYLHGIEDWPSWDDLARSNSYAFKSRAKNDHPKVLQLQRIVDEKLPEWEVDIRVCIDRSWHDCLPRE